MMSRPRSGRLIKQSAGPGSRAVVAEMRSYLALALAGTLGACAAPVGDFGRRDTGVYANAMTAVAGPFSPATGIERAAFAYTDEENELRAVGWDLVRPPDRDVPGNSLHHVAWWRALPDGWYVGYPEAYWSALMTLPVSSHETRYQRLILQARSDAARMPAFRDVAMRVGTADGARREAAVAISADRVLRQESDRRIAENRGVVAAVCRALALRIRGYRYALHRMMVEVPSTKAVEAQAAIDGLAWEAGECGGSSRPTGPATAAEHHRSRFVPRGEGPPVIK